MQVLPIKASPRTVWNLLSAEVMFRAPKFKIKINGYCPNRCCFCPYHDDPRRLNVKDLVRFFDMIEKPKFRRIDINGGEPTVYPEFMEICDFLRERFKGKVALHLGTNLIPLSHRGKKAKLANMFDKVMDTFDMISVGCDDEHENIDHLEELAPEIVKAGKRLCVNVLDEYCSEEIRARIIAVKKKTGMGLTFSGEDHFVHEGPPKNDASIPCRSIVHELVVDCNGDAFFCFHQEHEIPLFNLLTVNKEELNYYLDEHMPEPYRFCSHCAHYKPQMGPVAKAKSQDLLSAVGMAPKRPGMVSTTV